jgi:hypothetical protein
MLEVIEEAGLIDAIQAGRQHDYVEHDYVEEEEIRVLLGS